MKEETEIEYGKVEKLQPLFLESLEIYLKIRASSSSRWFFDLSEIIYEFTL